MPFFSIIIPSYNRADVLGETIKTVIQQTFLDWECIIVDDGSTDHTKEVIQQIIQNENRVRYVFQENAERSVARNTGIINACGNYICFLDSDDEFLENHLITLYQDITSKNYPEAMFFVNTLFRKNDHLENVQFPKISQDILDYLIYNPITPSRVCIHKNIVNELKFEPEIVIVEDLLLWIKISFHYPIFQIDKETVVYNIHDDNSVNIKNNSGQKRLDGLILFFRKYPHYRDSIPSKLRRFLLGDTHFGIMKYHLYNNHKIAALKHLFFSIGYQRFHKQLKHKILVGLKVVFQFPIDEYQK